MKHLSTGFTFLFFLSVSFAVAEEAKLQLGNEIIGGPQDAASRDAWFKKMNALARRRPQARQI